ncbi:MAG: hypothetical protein ACJ75J_01630 [Cytophagaceae bacterium]
MTRILVLIVIITAFSCQVKEKRTVGRSVYYWRSVFRLSEADQKLLDSLKIGRVYVKFFDVAWDDLHRAIPVAQVNFETSVPPSLKVVPVVFITNETLKKSKEEEISLLARRICRKILKICKNHKIDSFPEMQIDCDWSDATKDKYFSLLKELRLQPGIDHRIEISATIRLHQVKYFTKTGVPPVDKGLLMFYNMSAVNNPETSNSILDLKEAEKYVNASSTYPLPLDLALPLFSWGVVYSDNKLKGLMNNLDRKTMDALPFLIPEKGRERTYRCSVDTVFLGNYFRKGDLLRAEGPEQDDLCKISEITGSLLKKDSLNVCLFHFDPILFNQYGHEKIDEVYNCYR